MIKLPLFLCLESGLRLLISGMLLLTLCQPVTAQSADPIALEDQYFNDVFADPTNLLFNFKLAGAQIQNQNYNGAIGTLERVLALSPDNNEAQFLLASVQRRMGNLTEARRIFGVLLKNPKASQTEITQAKQILASIDAQNKPLTISGALNIGGGVTYNPEGGSIDNLAEVGGVIDPNGTFSKRANAEGFVTTSAQVNIIRKIKSQRPQSLSIGLSTFIKDFTAYDEGDLASLSINSEYIRAIENGTFAASLKAARIHRENEHYLDSITAKARINTALNNQWNATFYTGLGRSIYQKSFAADASEKTANEAYIGLRISRLFNQFQLGSNYRFLASRAGADYNSRDEHRLGLFASTNIIPGLTSIEYNITDSHHRAPEIVYNNKRRRDKTHGITARYIIGLDSLSRPVGNEARLHFDFYYSKTLSTTVNFSKYEGEASITLSKPF